jgi:predicted MPP superfamily phosphohydrolase
VPGLPRHLDGFSLAQITDAHLTGLGKVEQAIVSAVRTEQVQLLALTGDIVDSTSRCNSKMRSGLARLMPGSCSRGTGTSILPARFTCRPELPIFRLRQG